MENGKHWEYLAGVIAAVAIFICVWRIGDAFELNKSDWASWVQAVGSIGAIVGVFAVANSQRAHERALEERRTREDETRRLKTVLAILSDVSSVEKTLRRARNEAPVELMSTDACNYLQDCKNAIEALPKFDVPDPALVVHLIAIPRAIRQLLRSIEMARENTEHLPNEGAIQHAEVDNALKDVMTWTDSAITRVGSEIGKRKT